MTEIARLRVTCCFLCPRPSGYSRSSIWSESPNSYASRVRTTFLNKAAIRASLPSMDRQSRLAGRRCRDPSSVHHKAGHGGAESRQQPRLKNIGSLKNAYAGSHFLAARTKIITNSSPYIYCAFGRGQYFYCDIPDVSIFLNKERLLKMPCEIANFGMSECATRQRNQFSINQRTGVHLACGLVMGEGLRRINSPMPLTRLLICSSSLR